MLGIAAAHEVELAVEPEGMDAFLVATVRRGDRRAFDRLYERHARMVHAILLSRVPATDAEDLVQEVFLSAVRHLDSLLEPDRFGPWVAQMARNRAVDHLRARKIHIEYQDLTGRMDAPKSEAHDVLRVIRTLPEAYQETLLMRLCEEMTGPEIAARTGLTPDSVRVNLHRGFKLLRAALGEED